MRRRIFGKAIVIVLGIFISSRNCEAQSAWNAMTPIYEDYFDCPFYGEGAYCAGRVVGGEETPIDYHYTASSFYRRPERKYRGIEDTSFASGVSSYQGTSTGPGPNGGYPGSPRGIYPTNYIDNSLYPNSYMQFQLR